MASIPRVFERAAWEENEVNERKGLSVKRSATSPEVVASVWRSICPGLLEHFDVEMSLPLIYPRSLFVGNGLQDPRCPVRGLSKIFKDLETKYSSSGFDAGNLWIRLYDCAHEVSPEMWADVKKFLRKATDEVPTK